MAVLLRSHLPMLSVLPESNPEFLAFAQKVERVPAYQERQRFLGTKLCQRWIGYDFERQKFLNVGDSELQSWLEEHQYKEIEIQLGVYGFERWKQALSPKDRQNLLNAITIAFYSTWDDQEALQRLVEWSQDKDFSQEELKLANKALRAYQSSTQPTPSPQSAQQSATPSDSLDQIGFAIATIFNEFKATCRFLPPVKESPRCWEIQLAKGPGIVVSKFQGLADELLVSPLLKGLEMKSAPVIQRCPGIGISVQILKNSFTPIMLEDYLQRRKSSPTDPIVFELGIELSGQALVLDLSGRSPHFMVSSTTGGGKTNIQHTIVIGGAYRYSPAHLQFVLIDPKGSQFTPYTGLPHLWTGRHLKTAGLIEDKVQPLDQAALSDSSTIVTFFMKMLRAEVERRKNLFIKLEQQTGFRIPDIQRYNRRSSNPVPHLMLMVDETRPLIEMFDSEGVDFDTFITSGTELFRFAGIHFGCGMQYAKGVVLPAARENLAHKLVGFMSTPEASKALLGNESARSLGAEGEFIYQLGDVDRRFQAFYAGDEDADDCFIYRAVNTIKQQYGGFHA